MTVLSLQIFLCHMIPIRVIISKIYIYIIIVRLLYTERLDVFTYDILYSTPSSDTETQIAIMSYWYTLRREYLENLETNYSSVTVCFRESGSDEVSHDKRFIIHDTLLTICMSWGVNFNYPKKNAYGSNFTKKKLSSHKHIFNMQVRCVLSENMSTRSSRVNFESPLVSSVFSFLEFLRTLSSAAMFFLTSL